MSRPNRKTKIGTIVSTKNEKTATVAVTRQYRHPLYGKTISRTKKSSHLTLTIAPTSVLNTKTPKTDK